MPDLARGTLLQDLDQMFRGNYHWVYLTAYGVTGRPEDAEDVLQNLSLRLLQRGFPHDVRRNANRRSAFRVPATAEGQCRTPGGLGSTHSPR